MVNQWSLEKVTVALGYDDVSKDGIIAHKNFSQFCDFLKNTLNIEINIFDIGCGNGRIVKELQNYDSYVGVDINEYNVSIAKNNFLKNNKNHFLHEDIESTQFSDVMKHHILTSNICLLDSTFHMMENPELLMHDLLIPNFKFIYLARTRAVDTVEYVKRKEYHQWDGMADSSVNWEFGRLFFKDIGDIYKNINCVGWRRDFKKESPDDFILMWNGEQLEEWQNNMLYNKMRINK